MYTRNVLAIKAEYFAFAKTEKRQWKRRSISQSRLISQRETKSHLGWGTVSAVWYACGSPWVSSGVRNRGRTVMSSALKCNGERYQTLKCLGQAVITCASTPADRYTADTRPRSVNERHSGTKGDSGSARLMKACRYSRKLYAGLPRAAVSARKTEPCEIIGRINIVEAISTSLRLGQRRRR